MSRVNRPKVGNEAMRRFVCTVRNHLENSGAPHDDETLWHLLRRFQILAFDFDAIGSQARELAVERARGLLDPSDVTQAGAIWSNLIALSLRIAANGGDRDSTRLSSDLAEAGFRLQGSRRNQVARTALADAAHDAVADLRRSLRGVTLSRTPLLNKLRVAPDQGRYVEIRGEPGLGKSGLLGTIAAEVLTEGRAVVLTPERTVPGGWLGLRSALATEDGARAFLADLASDGGATLFVDGLDSFTDPSRQATVADLVRAAAGVPGLRVMVTARSGFDRDDGNWLPAGALDTLGRAPPVIVEDLGEEEIEELRAAVPALRSILVDDHPARPVARNLFRLRQFLHLPSSDELPRSEVDLLERWWKMADAGGDGRRERQRFLTDLADAVLKGQNWIRTEAPTAAIDPLIARGSLRDLGADRFAFGHDVLRDWAVAMLLHLDPARVEHLPLERPAPPSLARGVELAARLSLERSADGATWADRLARVSTAIAHPSWRRWSLLAVLRSEVAPTLLDQVAPLLLERDGALLRELIRTALAVEARSLDEALTEAGVTVPEGAARFFVPSNGSWPRLVVWLLARQADLPPQCLIDVVDLFQSLSASMGLQDPLTPLMAEALGDWLEEIEAGGDRRPGAASPTGLAALGHDEWRLRVHRGKVRRPEMTRELHRAINSPQN